MSNKNKPKIEKLKELYSKHPYPANNNHDDFFKKAVYPSIKGFEISKILEAGCGTGAVLKDIFQCFPEATITAIDFSENSLRTAKDIFNKTKFSNVKIENFDILNESISKFGEFDFIHSQGVIHHTENPNKAIKNLVSVLKDDGLIYIWVYFKTGRREISDVKEIMSFFDEETLDTKIEILKDVLKLKRIASQNPKYKKFLRKNRSRLSSKISLFFKLIEHRGFLSSFYFLIERTLRKIFLQKDFTVQENIGVADEYLNPLETFYDFEEFHQILRSNKLEIIEIIDGMSNDLEEISLGTNFHPKIKKLSNAQTYRLIELLDKPRGVGFLCKKD